MTLCDKCNVPCDGDQLYVRAVLSHDNGTSAPTRGGTEQPMNPNGGGREQPTMKKGTDNA